MSLFANNDGSIASYSYNADGIRTGKYFYDSSGYATSTVKYTLDGNKIVATPMWLRRLSICPEAIPDYVRIIFMDTLCANPDRHTNNFGLLRDVKTGKLLGLAPNYDNNMALISRGYPSTPKSGDLLIRLLGELLDKRPEYKRYLPTLSEDPVRTVLEKLNMRVKTQAVVDIVMSRYKLIKK